MSEVEKYLQKKKFDYREEGTQFVVRTCPFCGDDKFHFYVHKEKGLWDCKKCFQRGNLYTLKRELGDIAPIKTFAEAVGTDEVTVFRKLDNSLAEEMHKDLLNMTTAISYFLDECGYSRETIAGYKLGYVSDKVFDWVTIPHFRDGRLVNIKYRTLPSSHPFDKRFKREEGCESILFNEDCLKNHKVTFLTEGEKDALTLIDAGFENVVGTTAGAGSFLPHWYDQLVTMEKIYVCYDSDVAGQKGALEVAKRIGLDVCYNVVLPTNDVNDFWAVNKKDAKQKFEALVEQAKPFGRRRVKTMVDAFGELEKTLFESEDLEGGLRFSWDSVDNLVGPLTPETLIGLTAIAKTGKTSFSLESLFHWAYEERIPSLMMCLEMPVRQLALKIITCHRDVEVDKLSRIDFILSKSDLWDIPLYFANDLGEGMNYISDTIRYAVRRFGVRVVVFDNLHFLCRDIHNVTSEVGHVTRQFKLLAAELGISIILVVQPRKIVEGRVPGMMDLRDSSSIATDVDLLLILYRQPIRDPGKRVDEKDYETKEEGLDPRTIVTLAPSRYREGGRTTLLFDGSKSKFMEMPR